MIKWRRGILVCLLAGGCLAAGEPPASSPLTLPAIFSDHMVLQRDVKMPVWGEAAAGEAITVRFGTSTATTTADKDGHWRV